MTDIARQLDRLTSPDKNKRYDACEESRVVSDLPPEAIGTLETATNDPVPPSRMQPAGPCWLTSRLRTNSIRPQQILHQALSRRSPSYLD